MQCLQPRINQGSPARVSGAPDGGQVVHACGLGLGCKGAQLAAAAGDVNLRAPAIPVGAHAAEARALDRAARPQLRRQRRMRRLACRPGAREAMSHSSEGGMFNQWAPMSVPSNKRPLVTWAEAITPESTWKAPSHAMLQLSMRKYIQSCCRTQSNSAAMSSHTGNNALKAGCAPHPLAWRSQCRPAPAAAAHPPPPAQAEGRSQHQRMQELCGLLYREHTGEAGAGHSMLHHIEQLTTPDLQGT